MKNKIETIKNSLFFASLLIFFIYLLFFFGSQYRIIANDFRLNDIIRLNTIIAIIVLFVESASIVVILKFGNTKTSKFQLLINLLVFVFTLITGLIILL